MSHLRLRVAALVVLAGVVASSCSVVGGGGGGNYQLTAWFPKTIALFKDSQVRVLGLPAGSVAKVTAMGDKVRVDMKVKNSVPVPADVHATIVPLSLIGERYVQLFPVWTNGQPRAHSGDVIPMDRTSSSTAWTRAPPGASYRTQPTTSQETASPSTTPSPT